MNVLSKPLINGVYFEMWMGCTAVVATATVLAWPRSRWNRVDDYTAQYVVNERFQGLT